MTNQVKVRRFEDIIRVKGLRIAYVLWVPLSGRQTIYDTLSLDPLSMTNHFEESMVCFHGWLDNANSFATLAPMVAEKFNIRIIGIDLPGHGKSSHSPLGYYDSSLFMVTMLRILHSLNLRAFHLMGHSLSAFFLPYLTPILEHSGKFTVKSLICIEQFGNARSSVNLKAVDIDRLLPSFDEQTHSEQATDNMHSESDKQDIRKLPKLYSSIDELVRARIYATKHVYPGKQTIAEKSARLILERNVSKLIVTEPHTRKKQVKYYLRFDPKLKKGTGTFINGLVYDIPQMVKGLIAKTQCPMLAVFADRGWPNLDQVANSMRKLEIANLEIIRMKGSHHLHADDPDKLLEAITPFLSNAMETYKKRSHSLNEDAKQIPSKL